MKYNNKIIIITYKHTNQIKIDKHPIQHTNQMKSVTKEHTTIVNREKNGLETAARSKQNIIIRFFDVENNIT